MPTIGQGTGSRGRALQGSATLELRGNEELLRLFQKAERRLNPTVLKQALRPAAKVGLAAARLEAPKGQTKRLMRSIKIKAVRAKPMLMLVVDRKKALRISTKYPTGFPYVNWIISEKARGPKADKFLPRGWQRSFEQATKTAIDELDKMLKSIGILGRI